MVTILNLPAELVAGIVSYLDQDDIYAFRQASKYLEQSCISFGPHFFRKKGFLVTSASLMVLKNISEHLEFRDCMSHVWINPDCYTFHSTERDYKDALDRGEEQLDLAFDSNDSERSAFRECRADHRSLLSDPIALGQRLNKVFKALPNLRSIGMRRSEGYRPWGWRQLKNATGIDPRQVGTYAGGQQDGLSETTLLFVALMQAIATAATPITRLYTDSIEIDNIPCHLLSEETFSLACRNLVYLEINVHRGWLKKDGQQHIRCDNPDAYGSGLLRLLKAAPRLQELGLQIFANVMRSYMLPPVAGDPGSWLRSYPHLTLKKQVENVALTRLSRLKLEKITTSTEVLKSLLVPCESALNSIKLRDIRLISDRGIQRPWESIFQFLRDDCPNLLYTLLYHLMHDHGGVAFVENPPTMVGYLDILDDANNPNPPHGEHTNGEFFTKYEHIALEASGRDDVQSKLDRIVLEHYYQMPIFSYLMDDAVWDTETSDEES